MVKNLKGWDRKRGNSIEITLDPLTILLFGIIGFLMYQILKKDDEIDNYLYFIDKEDNNENIYLEDSNYDPVVKNLIVKIMK